MSVMIAVRHGGRVAVAVDSLWASGWEEMRRAEAKLTRRGDTIVTVGPASGYSDALQRDVLTFIGQHDDWHQQWTEHCLTGPDESIMRRLATAEGIGGVPVLVVWRGRIFEVRADGGIFETADPAEAVGCGREFAKGAALALMPHYNSARTIAIKAAEVACRLSTGCAPPILCESVRLEGH